MSDVSEAVERLRTHGLKTLPGETIQADSAMMDDLRAILTEIARLSEQVRVAMEGLKSIASDADSTRMAREANQTLTRMETTDGQ